ncbi:predicted protein [Streptomyces viridosporus ATCC 14672]|uniref:Predicted protein n=1 Tax=Streptomyces viridosporus (strain ATCC 14672 / DSM 40746 / JCM 4963 / KCTC 9882 / NRRL B-12104 / FH 1290) TaxID=566461 RepID=D6A6Z1_STRV1|nr:hypothetical protein [Streptomyces viridosporus]EFE71817.1 predicted protein [Streptomyces viridosporus ATCC 14672]
MTIFTKTEQVLRDAMERLLSGRPQHADGKLTKNNLCREAGVSRVTMHRAAKILTEWDARTATSSAGGGLQHQHAAALVEFFRKPCRSREGSRALQEQVDATATVIVTLLSENRSLRSGQVSNGARAVVPMPRHDVPHA